METAKRSGRTAFTQMIRFLRKHRAPKPVILVEKTDRLYRNLKDWVTVDDMAVDIHLVKDGVILSDASRSSEKFIHGIKVLMAKNYVDNLSEEVRKGMHQKAREGYWPSSAPFGYLNERRDGRSYIIPDPERALLVRNLFELYDGGEHSIKSLETYAHEAGLRGRRGGKLHGAIIHSFLRNPIYAGELWWGGRLYKGKDPKLISRELYDRVQARLDGHPYTRASEHTFACSGLVTCGLCGGAYTAEIKKGKYVYYRCAKNCVRGVKYVPERRMSEMIGEHVRKLCFPADVREEVIDALKSSRRQVAEEHRDLLKWLFSNFTFADGALSATWRKPFSFLADHPEDPNENGADPDEQNRRRMKWSGRPDSNRGPPGPKPGALPDCATPRTPALYSSRAKLASPKRISRAGPRGDTLRSMARILLIDDASLLDMLSMACEDAGHDVLTAPDGAIGLKLATTEPVALIVSDVNMPQLDGFSLCRKLREGGSELPIILLTSRDSEIDEALGLELGADDYVAKPFSTRVLLARITALLRRHEVRATTTATSVRSVGELTLDADRLEARFRGERFETTVTEFRLLEALTSRPGVVFSRDRLLELARGDDSIVAARIIDTYVRRLRRKIEAIDADFGAIDTVIGAGYRWLA